jgi:hypothetical protein
MPDNTLLVGLLSAGSVLAGVCISAGVLLLVSEQEHKRQMERDKIAREQSMRDDRQARIRQYFAKIYWAAYMQLSVAQRMPSVLAVTTSNPFEQQDILINELHQADAQTQEVLAILGIEGGNDDIIEAYNDMGIEFDRYIYVFRSENRQDVTGLEAAFAKLQDLMRLRYNELEKLMV